MKSTETNTMGPTLFGRERTVGEVQSVLNNALRHQGGALRLVGVAGIGKTAIVRNAIALAVAAGFEVRVATGVPIEADLPYGALSTLLAKELRDEQLATRAPAFAAAVGRSSLPEPPSVMEVAADVLELLSVRGRSQPVLLVIDDAQWVDRSTSIVVGHLARHAVADRLGVIVASRIESPVANAPRPDPDSPIVPDSVGGGDALLDPLAGIPTIELGPLSVEESRSALLAVGCPHEHVDHWALRCGGLPLAVAEVARRNAFAQRESSEIYAFLPDTYRDLVASLDPALADAALHVAICGETRTLRMIGGAELITRVQALKALGLIQPSNDPDERMMFRHPLLHAAVLAYFPSETQRNVHARVSVASTELGHDDLAAIHRAALVDEPDNDAADALSALGERAVRRGALTEAAHAWVRAAALYTSPDKQSAALTCAADAYFDGSDPRSAFATIDRAIDVAIDPRVRADAGSLRARMSTWFFSPSEMIRQLDLVTDAMRQIDPIRASSSLASAAGMGYLSGDIAGALQRSRESEQLATASGDLIAIVGANASLTWNLFMAGDISEFDRLMMPFDFLMRDLLSKRSWAGIHLAELFSLAWICSERWDLADPLVRELVRTTRTMGAKLTAASSTLMLSALCWRRGRWEEAYALARPLLDEGEFPPVTLCWMQVLVAQLSAAMGLTEETRSLVAAALPIASTAEAPMITAIGNAALGHLELSLGNDDAALTFLDRTAHLIDRIGVKEPEYLLWQGDYLDALVRAGRHEEAADRLVDLSKFADGFGRRWAKGTVSRTRAQIATDATEAESLFNEALWAFEDLGMPFEVARTLLARGRTQDLTDARRLFLRLGAGEWANAASTTKSAQAAETRSNPQSARRSAGTSAKRSVSGSVSGSGTPVAAATATPAPGRVLELLSPSERNVALGVSNGRTNREIAAELHLSAKTVDHYLQSAFRKVGVRNRTELATTLARELAAP